METTEHTKIKNGKAITVTIYPEGHAIVFDQAINPKTGKGWQKRRNLKTYENKLTAMAAWLKAA